MQLQVQEITLPASKDLERIAVEFDLAAALTWRVASCVRIK